ncbi:hypothetical protein OROGR_031122 [Orobanche gracilis]
MAEKSRCKPISDVSSDLTIEVGTASFALHRFPLVSQSGRIRKLLMDLKESKASKLNLSAIPGGSHAFEQAAKFCYGMNIDLTTSNIAALQEINLVGRMINAIADNAYKEQLTSGLLKLEHNFSCKLVPESETPFGWWGKSLTLLNLDFFQRVLSAIKMKGLKQDIISRILIYYAQNSLHGLVVRDSQSMKGNNMSDLDMQKKQRVAVETIISLLPTQVRNSTVPMAFLSSLLKSAIASSTAASCRSDLERWIGLQLDQAILEDILIPSNSNENNYSPLYDSDTVLRIFSIFLNLEEDEDDNTNNNPTMDESEMAYDFDTPDFPKQSSLIRVSKLLDNYLAEIALDPNLTPSKLTALAELMPDHARMVSDGLYRAVYTFLKVHPNMKDSERYRLCKTIDCQKLSQEACSHAAQNERLPVQMAVQVLYFEQIRLRNAMNGAGGGRTQFFFSSQFPYRSGSVAGSGCISPRDNYASVRRENRELKLEVARMRMRLTDLEKDHVSMKQELVRSHPANRLFKSFAKKLSSFFRVRDLKGVERKGE